MPIKVKGKDPQPPKPTTTTTTTPAPQPKPVKASAPSGAIATAGFSGVKWEAVTQYDDAIHAAADPVGWPIARVRGHILIESQGNPKAIQQNASNGYSYGLMQVVPYGVGWEGWHKLVKEKAGLPANASKQQVVEALYDPAINIAAGVAILEGFYEQHGTLDKASSAFFLGNPNWKGEDTVNGNTGTWYRNTLNALIKEQDANGTTPAVTTTLAPTVTTTTTPRPKPDPWRPYPYPPMVRLIVQKPAEGAGFDRVASRKNRIRGFSTHITDGSGSIEWLSAFFSTGGERAWDALTDTCIGRDGRIGLLNDWRDDKNGGTRAGWANGGVDGLEGDGTAFYRAFPDINSCLVSCEHVARAGEAWTDAMLESTIELRTAIAQELKCPWDAYPYHPAYGGVSIEQQHRNFATKACPANPYINQYDAVVKREVKAKLKAWQGGEATGPAPTPEPVWFTRFGFSLEDIKSFFGTITRHNLDGTTDELAFNPEGALSLLWLNRCDKEGKFPEAERIWYSDAQFVDGQEMWASWVGGWMAFLPLVDSRASWQWLDDAKL